MIIYRVVRIAETDNCEFWRNAQLLIWVTPVVNPILYSFLSKKFRERLQVLVHYLKIRSV